MEETISPCYIVLLSLGTVSNQSKLLLPRHRKETHSVKYSEISRFGGVGEWLVAIGFVLMLGLAESLTEALVHLIFN